MASRSVRVGLKVALVLCVFAASWNGACGTSDLGKSKANIQVSPAAVAFKDTIGNASPPPQNVAVSTDAPEPVTGLRAAVTYGASGSGWLAATLSDTMAPATLTLTSNIANLTAGTYTANVSLSANNAGNTPFNVPVTFEVAPPPPVRIALNPTAITFNDTAGSSSPAAQRVAVSADGVGKLTGLKASIAYASGGAGWLTATLSDTTAPATLTLTAKNSGLTAAAYHATVSVTATGAGISPQNVAVTFNIAAAPPVNGITVVAVGNLGRCGGELGKQSANAVAAMNPPPDYILMLGNSALPQTGKVTTYDDYIHCYDPVWGKWKSITYAVLGDHELDIDTVPPTYGTGMALGADAYFGPDRIGPPGKNWYSFDLGSWHIVALNIQSPGGYTRPIAIQFHAGSDQMNWLENDLSAHSNKCTLAFWYQAMWFSSKNIDPSWEPKIVNGDTLYKDGYRIQDIRGIWRTLYDGNADVVVNGTPHIYERFSPMDYGGTYRDPSATEFRADSVRGVREIISGLGGDGPTTYDQPAAVRHPLSEFRAGGNGVLKLVLGDGEYSWEFINTPYSQIHDSGHGVCH